MNNSRKVLKFRRIPEDSNRAVRPVPAERAVIHNRWKVQQLRPWTNEVKIIPYLGTDQNDWLAIQITHPILHKGLTNIIFFFLNGDEPARQITIEKILPYFDSLWVNFMLTAHGNTELVHNEAYSLLADARFNDPTERIRAERDAMAIPAITDMMDWGLKYVNEKDNIPLEDREDPEYLGVMLLQFICFEGIFFTGWFAIIYAVKSKGKFPALTSANEYIAPDEADHVENTVALYHLLDGRISESRVHAIFREAVAIAKKFLYDGFADDVPDFDIYRDDIAEYIELVANVIMNKLHYNPIYPDAKLRLPYMKNKDFATFASIHEASDPNYRPAIYSGNLVDPFDDNF